jgi:CRISPR-associated protein Cas1
VGLLVLSGRGGEATARLVGRPHDDVTLRLAQYRASLDASANAARARALVAAKLRGQARLLRRGRTARPDRAYDLRLADDVLATLLARLADPAQSFDLGALNGLEGAGAAAYFAAFRTLFPPALGFLGRRRVRRPTR